MILGIDFGSSNVDAVLMHGKKIAMHRSIEADLFNKDFFFRGFPIEKIKKIKVTGAYSGKAGKKLFNLNVRKVDEIKAIAVGGKFVSKKSNALIVSMGSGTAFVSVKGNKFRHIGGTAVGGKTLMNLGRLLIGDDNVLILEKRAKYGKAERVDLTLKEIYPKGIGLLPSNATASHFGSLKNPNKDDLSAALFNLVGQVVGSIAGFASKAFNQKTIVFTGHLAESRLIKEIIEKRIFWLGKAKTVFPKNSGIATAIGAALAWLFIEFI